MNILIVYYLPPVFDRNTITEHLKSFRRYSNQRCHYLNVFYGVPGCIGKIYFDLIVFHYTFFAYFDDLSKNNLELLKELNGYKVAIPQDELGFTDRLNKFFHDYGISTVYTCLKQNEWQHIYPRQLSGLQNYFTVFTGYVDEIAAEKQSKCNIRHADRPIDVGYRARKVPYWVGRFGLVKWQLTERFIGALKGSGLRYNLSNDERDVFYGESWYRFLSRCRVVLGCESGASLHDPDGSIRARVNKYVYEHPGIDFDQVEQACFPNLDNSIDLTSLSPRHFEACITKTCQALVEGEYGGIFKPGVHYIEIKRDWSNLPEVIEQIKDMEHCERIAERAYKDIVETKLYTYRRLIGQIITQAGSEDHDDMKNCLHETKYLRQLMNREKCPYIYAILPSLIYIAKELTGRTLIKLNLYSRK